MYMLFIQVHMYLYCTSTGRRYLYMYPVFFLYFNGAGQNEPPSNPSLFGRQLLVKQHVRPVVHDIAVHVIGAQWYGY